MASTLRWATAALALLLTACASGPTRPPTESPAGSPTESPAGSPAESPAGSPAESPAESPAGTLVESPAQLAGQRVVYSYPGPTPPDSLLSTIREGRAAGVIFFTENFVDPQQFTAVVGQLRTAQQQSPTGLPLLLMTDQEGGPVRRLPGAPELSAKQIGQADNPSAAAAKAGSSVGENLSRLGLNVNLAPVLDVYRTAGDFSDRFQRSFGSDPVLVAAASSAFITAQQRAGVAATAKHFPGLGSAAAQLNTDLSPVTLPVDAATLRATDERPYRDAIASGVQLVMPSWAIYPALDAERPAGLSPTVLEQELRGRLGYRGVTVTDALEAGALRDHGSTGERAVAAAAAGEDLLLCSARDAAQGAEAAAALADALTSGRLDRTAFTAATARITTLRAGLR